MFPKGQPLEDLHSNYMASILKVMPVFGSNSQAKAVSDTFGDGRVDPFPPFSNAFDFLNTLPPSLAGFSGSKTDSAPGVAVWNQMAPYHLVSQMTPGQMRDKPTLNLFQDFESDTEPPQTPVRSIHDVALAEEAPQKWRQFYAEDFAPHLKPAEDQPKEERLKLRLFKTPKDRESHSKAASQLNLREFVRKVHFRQSTARQYTCRLCGQPFDSKGGIGGHISRVHGLNGAKARQK